MDRVAAPHGPIGHGATVLLVDDQPTMPALVRRTLEVRPDLEALEREDTDR